MKKYTFVSFAGLVVLGLNSLFRVNVYNLAYFKSRLKTT